MALLAESENKKTRNIFKQQTAAPNRKHKYLLSSTSIVVSRRAIIGGEAFFALPLINFHSTAIVAYKTRRLTSILTFAHVMSSCSNQIMNANLRVLSST
jgi:hypothetical protein